MRDGGRLAAAIEVLQDMETRHRPAQVALRDWGASHRFAGSGDRTVIGNLVFDALRHKASLGAALGTADIRALVLATYAHTWGMGMDKLEEVLTADPHAPDRLSETEKTALAGVSAINLDGAAASDVPEWLWPSFQAAFGTCALAEGRALAQRAPIDLRVNTLKADPERVLERLRHTHPVPGTFAATAIRIKPRPGSGRMPHVQAEEGYRKGWFELQDEASQIVALLSGVNVGDQVLDFCAGGGGKTLAMAAVMENKGQIYAHDADRLRLAPIHERLQRAGVRNVQVRDPASSSLDDLKEGMDTVFVDAPCSGTGVWRRRPDSKWRLSEGALKDRIADQRSVLREAAGFVKPGGNLVYVTCSVLPEENDHQIEEFLAEHAQFQPASALARWRAVFPGKVEPVYRSTRGDILLTPATTETDGFFCALLKRKPA
ncbi:RsmB/NOP family class I SAM-dependent RNA methyltransferase [Roseibium aquae]|nr:RsmB/NOP family class I SAM-dependent RNA methyltransferase [Roseibium aquae]